MCGDCACEILYPRPASPRNFYALQIKCWKRASQVIGVRSIFKKYKTNICLIGPWCSMDRRRGIVLDFSHESVHVFFPVSRDNESDSELVDGSMYDFPSVRGTITIAPRADIHWKFQSRSY